MRSSFYHVDFMFNDDYTGIEWNGGEKASPLDEVANFLIEQMQKKFPDLLKIQNLM